MHQRAVQISAIVFLMGTTGLAVGAQAEGYPNYPTYITARGTVNNGVVTQAAPQAPVAAMRMPVPQQAMAMPRYQPATGNAVRYPAPAMQVSQGTARYAVPVGVAPSVQTYGNHDPVAQAQPRYAAPAAPVARQAYASAPTAQAYATMAPAAGQTQTNAYGNRFTYGDVREVVPGAQAKMDRAQRPMEVETVLGVGYRTGKMNWNIAGQPDGTSPNILSELDWKSLQFVEANAGARYVVPNGALKHVHLEGSGYYGYATSGDNQDSDYELDNRTNEFSRSNNNAEGSTAWGVKAAIGYELPVLDEPSGWQLNATPLIGYQKHAQRLRMQDGNQTLCNNAPSLGWDCTGIALGSFGGLNSRYKAEWAGPFVGMEGELAFTDTHRFRLRGEYGYMNYDATAKWNLRQDFQQPLSYKHDADGTGIDLSAEYRYAFDPTTGIVISAAYSKYEADDGRDVTFLAAGGQAETKLNEVSWESQAYRVGYEKQF